jgi:eukaryotic-like serine/threonine-protein kinase
VRLSTGSRLGPYEIVALLGVGGMGEVYRARDTKLNREVAIKVLPESVARDRDHLARFEREAQLLAALNHPHIAHIHGIEDSTGTPALVMELVEGPTLADRIALGAIPIDEALAIAKQIAEALEAAHEQGIIHRDLKPANINVRPDGTVKLLDFGLAKAFDPVAPPSGAASMAPTLSMHATQAGIVLGTPAYMAPEQACGKAVDRRADIWAFGCVLFEMLAGQRAFAGEDHEHVLASVMAAQPQWSLLPTSTPLAIRRLLRRCLASERALRLRDIADGRFALEDALTDEKDTGAAGRSTAKRLAWLANAVGLAVVGVVVLGLFVVRSKPESVGVAGRFTIAPPPGETVSSVAISPDGTVIAMVARGAVGRLFVRRVTELDAVPMVGSEGALSAFFSPDSQSIGFFAGGKLKTASLSGGRPTLVCDAPNPRGAVWAPDNTIIFAPEATGPLMVVPASGGAPRPLTRIADGEASHRWPSMLPDGKSIMYGAGPAATQSFWSEAHIVAQSLTDASRHVIVQQGTYPLYVEAGYVVYVLANALYALPFNAARRVSTGPAVRLPDRVFQGSNGGASMAISRTGTLVFLAPSGLDANTLVWVDRHGTTTPTGIAVTVQSHPRLSPDGTRLAYTANAPDTDIWMYDVARGATTRFTSGGRNFWPVWTPDGQHLAFTSTRNGPAAPFWQVVDGDGRDEMLADDGIPSAFSPDGKQLAFVRQGSSVRIWTLGINKRDIALVSPPAASFEVEPAFSADGRWMAYVSTESGRNEVWVRAVQGTGRRFQVSVNGGNEPVWSRDGHELFYRTADQIMSAAVITASDSGFRAAPPQPIVKGRFTSGSDRANFDVTPDGQRFIIVQPANQAVAPTEPQVVLRWTEELQR